MRLGSKYDILKGLRLRADITVRTIAERDFIRTYRRRWGMVVAVWKNEDENDVGIEHNGLYKLVHKHYSDVISDNENWVRLEDETIWIKKVVDNIVDELPEFVTYYQSAGTIFWRKTSEGVYKEILISTLEGYTGGAIELSDTLEMIRWRHVGDTDWNKLVEVDQPHVGRRIILTAGNQIHEYKEVWVNKVLVQKWVIDPQTAPMRNGLTAMIAKSPTGKNQIYTYSLERDEWLPHNERTIWIRKTVNRFVYEFPEDPELWERVIILAPEEDMDIEIDVDVLLGQYEDLVYNGIYEWDGEYWKIDIQCEDVQEEVDGDFLMRNGLTAVIEVSGEGENQIFTYHQGDDEWKHIFPRTIWIRKPVDEIVSDLPVGVEGYRVILESDVDADISGMTRNRIYEFIEGEWIEDRLTNPLRDGLVAMVIDAEFGKNRIHIYFAQEDEWRDMLRYLERWFTGWIFPPVDEILDKFPLTAAPGYRLIWTQTMQIYTYIGEDVDWDGDWDGEGDLPAGWLLDWQTDPLVHGSAVLVWDSPVGERWIYIYDETVHDWLPTGGMSDLDLERFQTTYGSYENGLPRRVAWPYFGFDPSVPGQEPDFFNLYQSGKYVFFENMPNLPGNPDPMEGFLEEDRRIAMAEVAFHHSNNIAVWYYRTTTGQVFFNHKNYEGWNEWREVCFDCGDFDIDVSGGQTPEYRVHAGWAQWKYTDEPEEEWRNWFLIPVDGEDGLTPEYRYHGGWAQWKYTTEGEEAWRDWFQVVEGDVSIDEYEYWTLKTEPSDEEIDADADVEGEQANVNSKEVLTVKGSGGTTVSLDVVTKTLTIHSSATGGGGDLEDIAFEFRDVERGTVQEYVLDIKASFPYTIDEFIHQTEDGTFTGVSIAINDVNVETGITVGETVTATPIDASVAVDDKVKLKFSSSYTGSPSLIRGKLKTSR